MADISTSPQVIGQNLGNTMNTRLYAWYDGQSGNTCTVHVRLTVVNTGATYTGTNKSYFIQIGGYNSGVQAWTYTPLNTGQEYTVAEATQTYSGGDAISASAGYWTYNYGSADIGAVSGWYVPTFSSPPTGLSTQLREVYPNGAKIYVSVSSYGNPSSASGRYVEAAILSTNNYGAEPRRYLAAYNISSSNIVVNNTSAGTLTIQPNTQYYYGAYASNTVQSTSAVSGQLVTAPPVPTVSVSAITDTSIAIDYSIGADGGHYTKELQYSIDGGTTWVTVDTIPATATTGTFTITATPRTHYTVKTRTTTTAGNSYGTELSVLTPRVSTFYGSVSGTTKGVNKMYGSVSGQSKRVNKLYGSVNGVTTRIL